MAGLCLGSKQSRMGGGGAILRPRIAAGTSYISHGEMQTGLSLDGKTWAPGLEQKFLAGLGSFDGTRGLAIVRGACGKIVAPANVTWCFETADAPFATLQDKGTWSGQAAAETALKHNAWTSAQQNKSQQRGR